MNPLAITGIGSVTPVGLSAPASAASFRAGVARLTSLQALEDHAPEGAIPIRTGGRVPLEWLHGGPVEELWPGHERFEIPLPPPATLIIEEGVQRLVALAKPAAEEALNQALSNRPFESSTVWGLFLGIGVSEGNSAGEHLATTIATSHSGFRPSIIEVVPQGRAAGIAALHAASEAISKGKVTKALIGGVDSLIRPKMYDYLESAGIIKGSVNEHGVLPGEAAAFCVLEKSANRDISLAQLTATAIGIEPTAGTENPNQAQGLTGVLRSLRNATNPSHMPLLICDLNGDRYRALEWGMALTRVFGNLHEKPDARFSGDFWHPSDCTGDTGAASGIVNLIWAVESLRKSYATVDQVMLWGASDGPLRAGAVISTLK